MKTSQYYSCYKYVVIFPGLLEADLKKTLKGFCGLSWGLSLIQHPRTLIHTWSHSRRGQQRQLYHLSGAGSCLSSRVGWQSESSGSPFPYQGQVTGAVVGGTTATGDRFVLVGEGRGDRFVWWQQQVPQLQPRLAWLRPVSALKLRCATHFLNAHVNAEIARLIGLSQPVAAWIPSTSYPTREYISLVALAVTMKMQKY